MTNNKTYREAECNACGYYHSDKNRPFCDRSDLEISYDKLRKQNDMLLQKIFEKTDEISDLRNRIRLLKEKRYVK